MAHAIKLANRYLIQGKTYEVTSIRRNVVNLKDINEHRPTKGYIQRSPEQLMAAKFLGSGI